MKKHIKKVLALVGILVVCISAFVVPCFAMYVPVEDINDVYELIGVQPVVTITYNDYETYIDTDTVMTVIPYDALSVYDATVWDTKLYSATTDISTCVYKGYEISQDFQELDTSVTIQFPSAEIDRGYAEFPMPYIYNINTLVLSDIGWTCSIRANYYDENNNYLGTYERTTRSFNSIFKPYDTIVANAPDPNWDTILIEDIVFEVDAISNQRLRLVVPYALRPSGYLGDQIGWLAPQNFSNRYTAVHVGGTDFNFGEFLWESVEGFMMIDVLGGVPMYIIFSTIVGVPLFIWFLKIFAGG